MIIEEASKTKEYKKKILSEYEITCLTPAVIVSAYYIETNKG